MGILIALIPALGWGIQAIVMQKVGGKFTNKTVGMTLTTVVFGIIIFLFHRPEITASLLWGSLLSGVCWSIGQILQVKSFDLIGVSKTMPISTGEQLIVTTLLGATILGEWQHGWQFLVGLPALALIILGITFTTIHDHTSSSDKGSNFKLGMIILAISTLGMAGYAVFPQLFGLNGWDVALPQSLAMLLGTVVLSLFQKDNDILGKKTLHNMLTGICFGIANLGLLFSNQINGVAVGFTLSQLSVIISTLGGIWILYELKSRREMRYTLIGLFLVVIGAVLIGVTKQ
ncbi:GRP family sugar transporter [Liquorilactobacillus hordei]|uniref:GRP family sugar transporter n=1 Tax=Liquorilactobacillus hordei TaxID=468911 RepID=UPI0039E8A7B7